MPQHMLKLGFVWKNVFEIKKKQDWLRPVSKLL
jgi:hypothetical protein